MIVELLTETVAVFVLNTIKETKPLETYYSHLGTIKNATWKDFVFAINLMRKPIKYEKSN